MKKLLPIIISLLALQNTFALNQNEPTTCPSVSSLASVGVDSPFRADGSWNVSKQSNNYGTPQLWTFVFMTGLDVDDVTSEQATVQANANISKLMFPEGPVDLGDDGIAEWWCAYRSENGSYDGVALTPPKQLPDQMSIVKKYLTKHS